MHWCYCCTALTLMCKIKGNQRVSSINQQSKYYVSNQNSLQNMTVVDAVIWDMLD